MLKLIIVALLLFVPAAYATQSTATRTSPSGEGGNITAASNKNDAWSASVVVIDGYSYIEDCVVNMSKVTKEQPVPKSIGKACARIRIDIPGEP
ncbi:hypothetical protein [Pseudomonas huaxiensis]|uniref:hypothetical protein n=1 Tax=Pseudomonas huaxiensis TaxID=2213017 RepID=UPI001300288B|nr:hypothetical protein [Pseudomonas huaxiensis]